MQGGLYLAPMMGYTHSPYRLLVRLLSPTAKLFTEMVTVNAIIHNPQPHYFERHVAEGAVVYQLGGSDPALAARAAKCAIEAGFAEININAGCPSDRVQNGAFGACLFYKPELVADMVRAIRDATGAPVSVKHRIGADDGERDLESFDALCDFVGALADAGVDGVIVHARKAILKGLNPKKNRNIPTLRPDWVERLQAAFPDLPMCYNGELESVAACTAWHARNIGAMVGRYAWQHPMIFAEYEAAQHGRPIPEKSAVLARYAAHFEGEADSPNKRAVLALTGLYHGGYGAKQWRRAVSENAYRPLNEAFAVLQPIAEALETRADKPQAQEAQQLQEVQEVQDAIAHTA